MKKYIIVLLAITVIFALAVIGLILFYASQFSLPPKQQDVVFKQEGNAIKDGPGLKPGIWHISYELPGQPGFIKELDIGNVQTADLQNGMRVYIEGRENDGVVKVSALKIMNPYFDDLIWVENVFVNQIVTSPITVSGQARGNWYFEANFPITLFDANGNIIAQKPVQAQGDWMTVEYVPFSVTFDFINPTTDTGTLLLHNDNPSGLPENDRELSIPVRFEAVKKSVKLYYYNADKDKDVLGNIQCSAQGLVALDRQIAVSQTPIQDTISLLLQGHLTQEEKSQGISTEYPLAGFSLKSANLKNGLLTLEFSDAQSKTVGGACRVGILWAQIEATAKQFPEVSQVKFIPEELFQP